MSDKPLYIDNDHWVAFIGGNKAAFEGIYSAHIEELISYGYRVSRDKQLIRDCIQDLFLYMWQNRQNLSTSNTNIKFYLYKSLRNRILRALDSAKEEPLDAISIFDEIKSELDYSDKLISETEEDPIKIINLKAAILKLPKRQQEVLQLRYFNDFNFNEIADIMQITQQSVRNFLHRAITELRACL